LDEKEKKRGGFLGGEGMSELTWGTGTPKTGEKIHSGNRVVGKGDKDEQDQQRKWTSRVLDRVRARKQTRGQEKNWGEKN